MKACDRFIMPCKEGADETSSRATPNSNGACNGNPRCAFPYNQPLP